MESNTIDYDSVSLSETIKYLIWKYYISEGDILKYLNSKVPILITQDETDSGFNTY